MVGVRNRAVLEEACETSLRKAALWDKVKDRLNDSALGLSGGQMLFALPAPSPTALRSC